MNLFKEFETSENAEALPVVELVQLLGGIQVIMQVMLEAPNHSIPTNQRVQMQQLLLRHLQKPVASGSYLRTDTARLDMATRTSQNGQAPSTSTDKWELLGQPTYPSNFIFRKEDRLCNYAMFDKLETFDPFLNRWEQHLSGILVFRLLLLDRYFTYDEQENTIWIHSFNDNSHSNSLYIIRLDAEEMIQEVWSPNYTFMEDVCMVIVGDTLHIIGMNPDSNAFTHILLNKRSLDVEQREYASESLLGYGGNICIEDVVHVQSTNNLFVFGIVEDPVDHPDLCEHDVNVLFCYSLENQEWKRIHAENQSAATLGMDFFDLCTVVVDVSKRERYILLFRGGEPDGRGSTDGIVLYDIERNVFRKCSLKLPSFVKESSRYNITTIRYRREDEMVVSGFFRQSCKSMAFFDVRLMSSDLIKLLCQWMCIEYAHFIEIKDKKTDGPSRHFRISIADILMSIVFD